MTDDTTKSLDFIFVRMEAEIREKIAKEIEAYLAGNIDIQPWIDARHFKFIANLVRGNND